MNKWFLAALGLWFFAICNHFTLNLFECWDEVTQQHAEEVNKRTDCRNIQFAERYPTECDFIRHVKYRSFFSKWVSVSIDHINWCGPVQCDDFFSFKGVVLSSLMLMLARTKDAVKQVRERIKI